jgi:hypothetical protein
MARALAASAVFCSCHCSLPHLLFERKFHLSTLKGTAVLPLDESQGLSRSVFCKCYVVRRL